MILDQLDGILLEIRRGRIGFASFCALCLAGSIAFILAHRPDQYCFAPAVHNWAYKLIRVCFLVELGATVIAFFGLFLDKDKLYAVLTLALFLPVFIAGGLAMGCN
jgi:hypothetical protein